MERGKEKEVEDPQVQDRKQKPRKTRAMAQYKPWVDKLCKISREENAVAWYQIH